MDYPLETLVFSAREAGVLTTNQSILFINAQPHKDFKKHEKLTCLQNFYPYAKTLLSSAYTTISHINNTEHDSYDTALILLPHNIVQARYYIALAVTHLTKNGTLICAAPNNAGGKRLKSILNEFKIQNVSYVSKNKCRALYCTIDTYDTNEINQAIEAGKLHYIKKTGYYAQAGIYGWDKIDTGSRILTENIDIQSLQGNGADFGCGYGYLAKTLLGTNHNIKKFYCIDADYNALLACRKNLSGQTTDIEYIWDDLTAPDHLPQNLDFIIMNPPFHQGKTADTTIGQAFIKNAAHALKQGGTLWMVANTHLPYEDALTREFSSNTLITQENGFKVIRAVR